MTQEEFAQFAMALRTYYPRENLLPNKPAMALWYQQLEDIPYNIASAVLQQWVANNKWSPAVSDIREGYATATMGELPDWGEGWQEVQRAIRRYGMYRVDEAIESLSPITAEAAKRIGFRNICISENQEATRANFRMIYESLAVRHRKEMNLPPKVRELLTSAQQGRLENADIRRRKESIECNSEA